MPDVKYQSISTTEGRALNEDWGVVEAETERESEFANGNDCLGLLLRC
jgi:hypothetical protein